jgi:hypothetical protein
MQSFDKLKPHYPTVWNPELGDRYLVVWHTDNNGNHVIVAENQDNALEVWNMLHPKNNGAKVRSCHRVTLVPVPDDVARAKAEQVYENELYNFDRSFCGMASMVFEDTKTVPEGFILCKHREDSKRRWDCKRCHGLGLYLPEGDIEKLFNNPLIHEIRETYHDVRRGNSEPQPKPSPATVGPLVDTSKPLMVAITDGGHHHPGVCFQTSDKWVSGWDLPVLFFFQGDEVPIPDEFTMAEKEAKARMDERREISQRTNKKDQEARTASQLDYLKRVVGLLRGPSA